MDPQKTFDTNNCWLDVFPATQFGNGVFNTHSPSSQLPSRPFAPSLHSFTSPLPPLSVNMDAERTSWNPAKLTVRYRHHRFSLLGLVLLAVLSPGLLADIGLLMHALITRRRRRAAELVFVPLLAAIAADLCLIWSHSEKAAACLPRHERGRGGGGGRRAGSGRGGSSGGRASAGGDGGDGGDGGHGSEARSSFIRRHGPISASAVIEHITLPEKAALGPSPSHTQPTTSFSATTATTATAATTTAATATATTAAATTTTTMSTGGSHTPPGRANSAASRASTASGCPSKYARRMMQNAPSGLARTMSSKEGYLTSQPAAALPPLQ